LEIIKKGIEMKRALYRHLLEWKDSKKRKPLLLQGARQVGKTWLVNEFAKNEYKKYVYLNFEQTPGLKTLFSGELSPEKIIESIGLYIGEKISREETLIFFDEIQASQQALTSLKYFYEQAPGYHIISAGSLLGVSIGKSSPFPVGKVNFMHLYPMSFFEFLSALNEDLLIEKISLNMNSEPIPEILHEKLINLLKIYLFLGGMPEVVNDYIENKDIQSVRHIQNEILEAYKRDFSKYTDSRQALKTSEVWNSIPYQLAKENKKFKYSDVRINTRAGTYEQTIEWLSKAGLVYPAKNITVPKLPLSGYVDYTKFKIYMPDTGLLAAMLNLSASLILEPLRLFSEYNGAFTENFVANELVASGSRELYYWTSKNDAEVDFIIEKRNKLFPVEVKSGLSRHKKSLTVYNEKFNPELIFRLSPKNFTRSGTFINLPLYAVANLFNEEPLINHPEY
jgi:predicted AAA+ superfamily ATPase